MRSRNGKNEIAVSTRNDQNSYECFDEYTAKLIRHKARSLIGSYGLTESDIPDIEQELAMALFRKLPLFNALKARMSTFVARVVERKIRDMIRHRSTQVRNWRLDDSVQEERDRGYDRESEIEEASQSYDYGLHADIAEILNTLPEDLRELCLLLEGHNVTEISRKTGVSRRILYKRISELRRIFRAAGMEDYFE